MNASQYAGTVIVPTLSRIVLCAAFFTAGWGKMFTEATYNAEEVQTLQKLGVDVTQSVAGNFSPGIIAVAERWELPAQDEQPTQPDVNPVDDTEAQTPADTVTQTPPPTVTETEKPEKPTVVSTPVDDGSTYKAPARYKVAILLDRAGWQYAPQLALVAALTELIGGALLLIGLFSRVWGLGLAIAMAMAFHVTSMDPYLAAPFEAAQTNIPLFNQVYAQAALFVLAFGIFITGPGPLSLDRAIFRRSGPSEVEIDIDQTT